jgi:hypothetical protein
MSGMRSSRGHLLRGVLNGGDDARIGSAAANVALERAANFGFVGLWTFLEEADAREDHAGRAISALERVLIEEGLLNWMKPPVLFEALDGGDLFASDRENAGDAGAHGRAVDQDGAGAALALAASVLGAGEGEVVAEDPEEHAVGVEDDAVMLLVEDELHTSILRPRGQGGGVFALLHGHNCIPEGRDARGIA